MEASCLNGTALRSRDCPSRLPSWVYIYRVDVIVNDQDKRRGQKKT